MHIYLKVSGLTKCMLKRDYQQTTDGRLLANAKTHLHHAILMYSHKMTSTQQTALSHQTHEICVEMGYDVRIGRNIDNIGHYLHSHHVDICMKWIMSGVRSDVSASQAIRNLYDEYDIDENDWSMETMHRTWGRYCKALENYEIDGPIRKSRTEAMRPGRGLPHLKAIERRMSLPIIDLGVLSRIVGENLRCFALKNDRYDIRLYKGLKAYVYRRLGYKNIDIANVMGVSNGHAVYLYNRWRNALEYDAALRVSYHKIIGEWLASLSHERTIVGK